MNEQRGQQLIVGCLAGAAAVAAVSAMADGEAPGMRLAIGAFGTGIGLATVNMFAPNLAGSMAVLILTTTVFVYGEPALKAVSRLTSPAGTKAAGTTRTQTGALPA